MTQAIIRAQQLKQWMDEGRNICVLDASYQLSGEKSCREKYEEAHIPGAQFFDIEEICDKDTNLPHMLPSAEMFEKAVGALGAGNDQHIVVYGQESMVMGPARVWWMFRVFGHDDVCILDGGLKAWAEQGYEITNQKANNESSSIFKSTFRPSLLANKSQVEEAIGEDDIVILDARPAGRFLGEISEPRPGLRMGNIKGSKNLPCSLFIKEENGQVKDLSEIKTILTQHNVQKGSQIITTCGSGVTACFLALILYWAGYGEASVYDGSWAEWGCCAA